MLEDHKLLKEKYSRLKAKFIQMDTKIKALLSEKDKINSEKMQLQEKNHTYLQDATRLHQLSEEMKEFENKVHIKKIFQLEKNIANLEIENKTLKSSFHEQIKPKSNILLEQNDNLNIKENKGRFENKIEKLIKENNKLVISMQSALDSCSNIKIPDINTNDHIINSTTDVPNKDLKELLIKIDRLLNENEILKNQDKTKDLLITELREKLDKKDGFYQIKEDFSDIGKKNNETIKFLEERLKAKENEVHSLEIRLKFFEENEVKLKSQLQTQLEFKNKDRNDSNVLETMQMKINELELKNSRVQHDYYNRNDDFLDSSKRRNFEVENEINELKKINEEIKKSFNESNSEKIRLKEMIEKQKLDFELEKELRNQYFINIKELEAILRDLMNEGDMFRHHIKKTISEENQKILEKYRILLEEKPSE